MDKPTLYTEMFSTENREAYRNKLTFIMRKKEINQKILAKEIGISQTALRKFLVGSYISEKNTKWSHPRILFKVMNYVDAELAAPTLKATKASAKI